MSTGTVIGLVLAGIVSLCVVCGGGLFGLGMLLPSATPTAIAQLVTMEIPSSTPLQATDTNTPQPTETFTLIPTTIIFTDIVKITVRRPNWR